MPKKPVIAEGSPEYQTRFEDICKLLNIEKKVEIYKNLHTGMWSVRQQGLVKFHTEYLTLENCEFVVRKAGRERVLQERRKNVHAFVRGHICKPEQHWRGRIPFPGDAVSYNPYHAAYFFTVVDMRPIRFAKWVDMHSNPDFGDSVVAIG